MNKWDVDANRSADGGVCMATGCASTKQRFCHPPRVSLLFLLLLILLRPSSGSGFVGSDGVHFDSPLLVQGVDLRAELAAILARLAALEQLTPNSSPLVAQIMATS